MARFVGAVDRGCTEKEQLKWFSQEMESYAVALPCPAIFLSATTPPDIREPVEGLSDPGNS